ncbi:MAG TPA: sugar phosphate isomerase/epimerase [Methylomirabilota bacterium]|nr:sugar phosphate isomerase/epimerase [Methylomirabilota bacterium]
MAARRGTRGWTAGRREFLATLLALVAPGWGRPGPAEAARLGAIGVQLYTVRALLEQDFEGTLAGLAAIGFREVEFAGYRGRTPQAVRAALTRAGLAAPSAHVSIEAVRDDLPRLLDGARAMGHRYVVVAWLPAEQRTPDGYRAAADLFNRVGRQTAAAGIQFAYHNHADEFARLDRGMPYDLLLERCDPRYVAFEMDLYWITKGGQDPLAYFARWPGRFPLVHVKDSSGAPDHRMVDVGAGSIPWKAILTRREQAGIRHYFVEHDAPGDPLASVRRSYEYLRGLDV